MIRITMIYRNLQWALFHITNALNANNRTMVDEKHVIKLETITPISRKKSLCVESVQLWRSVEERRHVKLTEQISLNTNVNSAVVYHNGFAGVIRISVSRVTNDNVQEIMFREKVKTSFRSAQDLSNVL